MNEHAKDIVRLGSALIATIVGLVLGLLITSAKATYDAQRNEVRQITSKLVQLDNQLRRYGPEALRARELQRQATEPLIDRIWGQRGLRSAVGSPYQPSVEADRIYDAVEALTPQNEVQRNIKLRALATLAGITEARVLLFEESEATPPVILLVVVSFWLTFLFAGYTLFSPINSTSAVVLAIIAVSASAAIFLILEMNDPFNGLMMISREPLQNALGKLGP